MDTHPLCIDCIEKAAGRTLSNISSNDEDISQAMIKVNNYMDKVNISLTPLEISFGINEIIREETGIYDSFKLIKEESNNNALKLISRAEALIEQSMEPLFDAVRIAIAGNIIDYGIKIEYNLSKTLDEVMGKKPFINDYQLLKRKLSEAKTINFIADNAGEIVFDRLLIEQINRMFKIDKINLLVKKYPFMNDVILEDLEGLGFADISNVEIIAIENLTTKDYFREMEPYIEQADVIIAKGQGNFELLYDRKKGVFFLFIVKCAVVKDILQSEEEDVIIAYQ
ncbi:MAG: protein-glutamate O-methyltransferase family protein [Candidatus Heimdallarchaeota archaeon]|nr:protein-glutamate O-methyltransferase family protein [Candidatus Heimdallarchaeota archaeon]